jgi:DNA-binding HxlR family transcriptional regulator
MAGSKGVRRSACPLNATLEIFGDAWSLLIVRDLLFMGRTAFKELLEGGEGIATNILAARLQRLEAHGIIERQPDASDARKTIYRLTPKGLDLAPVLVELILWAARHEQTDAPQAVVRRMTTHREQFIDELRRCWAERTPPSLAGAIQRASRDAVGAKPDPRRRREARSAPAKRSRIRTGKAKLHPHRQAISGPAKAGPHGGKDRTGKR